MRLILVFVLLASVGTASAQEAAPKPEANSPSAAEASMQGYGDREKTCFEWNDGCRTCRRQTDGKLDCSNIGIACQPTPIACTGRIAPPK